jgi:glycolate oxidase
MDRILEINTEDLVAVVEPGVFTGRLKEAVAQRGLFYPPDPASYQFSTIGGNVATGAGGPKGLKYGVTKDYVLGLEVVLATGEVVCLGTRTVKGVVGYDLVHLFVGSEGTLGIITKIILKLLPKPPARAVVLAGFRLLEEAVEAFGRVLAAGILPATTELMDDITIAATAKLLKNPLPEGLQALLLLEVDGPPRQVQEELEGLRDTLKGAPLYREAQEEEKIEELWRVRRNISPALKTLAPNKIADDVVLPRSRLVRFVNFVKDLREREGLPIACFGHLGDGNLHVNILFEAKDPGQKEKALKAREEILEKVLTLSGTISGEHGIGLTKRAYLPKEIPPPVRSLMQDLKRVFDPRGILNPGKIF